MLILAVDTTTPWGSTALLEGERVAAEFSVESPATHSARLMRTVDCLLAAAGRSIKDVEAFAAAAGPGSFTGIRIGLSAVKSLALASGRPAVGVSTLEALALKGAAFQARLVAPMLDAKKNELYAALFEVSGKDRRELLPQAAYDPDAFFSRLPSGRVIHFVGNGVRLYERKLVSYMRDKARFLDRSDFLAAEVGRLGYRKILAGDFTDAAGLEPIYLRKSQAEGK
jgi:tRNA threonylcarbamoyladenosine biosynthesis protein TsaB